jgi:hypothetical protein
MSNDELLNLREADLKLRELVELSIDINKTLLEQGDQLDKCKTTLYNTNNDINFVSFKMSEMNRTCCIIQ